MPDWGHVKETNMFFILTLSQRTHMEGDILFICIILYIMQCFSNCTNLLASWLK